MKKLLQRIRDSGLRLNLSKCVFRVPEITFLGHVVSADGLKIDPRKCDAISNYPEPQNQTELKRFLGMINYVGKFIPNLADITAPLRCLLQKDVEFIITKA